MSYLAGVTKKSIDHQVDAAKPDDQQEEAANIKQQLMGENYMKAYDAENRRIKIEDAEKAARGNAMNVAVRIKAQAIADAKQQKSVKAVQAVKAAQAKMDSAEKGVKVAGNAMKKGWLKPKLAAEMKLAQKTMLKAADKKVKKVRRREIKLKTEVKDVKLAKQAALKKGALKMDGVKTAQAATNKEMAMKFVKAELERRKKAAYTQ